MKISVVIPFYHGEEYAGPLLEAVRRQDHPVAEVWVVETDPTAEVERHARRYGAEYVTVAEGEFDHAGTRTRVARRARGDVLLFLTQDVMPVDDGTFGALLAPLTADPTVAAVYGRQVPAAGAHPFAAVKRLFNYPDESTTKSAEDVKRLGLRTVFMSNAFAAYRRQALADVGWFPDRQLMCEDVTAAARLLAAGHRIHYAADAQVLHTHELGWRREMRRYFDVGAAHREQPWIRRRFGHPNSDGLRYLGLGIRHLRANGHPGRIPEFVLRCGFGRLAFTLGSHNRMLPVSWCARLSTFPVWWVPSSAADEPGPSPKAAKPSIELERGSPRTLVLLPTYNEAENIARVIDELFRIGPAAVEIAVVDDESPDGTASIVRQLQAEWPERLHLIRRNGSRGLGRAYRDGFRFALARGVDRVVCMDADLSHDPRDVRRMIDATEGADIAIGSRYVAEGALKNWPIRRVLLSRWANRYARWITGTPVNDTTSGFKCLRREVIDRLDLDRIASEGYAFQIELHFLAHQARFRIREVPITFTDRNVGESKMNGRIVREAVIMPWRLIIRAFRGRLALREPSGNGAVDTAKSEEG